MRALYYDEYGDIGVLDVDSLVSHEGPFELWATEVALEVDSVSPDVADGASGDVNVSHAVLVGGTNP